jgi:cytochrome c-type biogenesis protein CcmH
MKDDVQKLRKMLQDLRDLRTTGFVDEEQYAENVERLERRLLDAVMAQAPAEVPPVAPPPAVLEEAVVPGQPAHRPPGSGVGAGSGAAAWMPGRGVLAAAVLLLLVGAGSWWAASRMPAGSPLAAGDIPGITAAERQVMTPDQLAASAEKLARRLVHQPQDAGAWATLARLYSAAGRHPEAAAAYEKAVALRADDASLLADFAEARAVTNNGNLAGEPTQLLMRALRLDPNHLQSLSLAGTAAFDRKDYAMAVAYWEKIIEIAPAGDPRGEKARSSVVEARELARQPMVAQAASTAAAVRPGVVAAKPVPPALPPAAAASAGISGTVTLAPSLASRARPGDTVFIYARAVDGPPFPLAVIRKQVKDLPMRFTLDDSMSMWPSAKVSGFSQVVVTARVSKSGEGPAQNGDLQGQSPPVAAGATGLRIDIRTVVGPPGR